MCMEERGDVGFDWVKEGKRGETEGKFRDWEESKWGRLGEGG